MLPLSRLFVGRLLLVSTVFALIFGAKLRMIEKDGSDVPYWDQWDGEGENLFQAQGDHTLTPQNFFRPHNEHRPVLTRILALGLLDLNDHQWDPRLEQVVNAALHSLVAVLLIWVASGLLPWATTIILGALTIIFFSTNVSWENTLSGFQSQFYFVILFSLGQIVLTFAATPLSRLWWLALLCGVAALFSMAAGFLGSVAIIGAILTRAVGQKHLSATEGITIAANSVLVGVGWLLKHEVPGHAGLRVSTAGAFIDAWVHQLAWPLTSHVECWSFLGLIAPGALLLEYVSGRIRGAVATGLLAASAWAILQTAAIAFARGGAEHGYSSRYTDTLLLGILINVLCLAYLASASEQRRVRIAYIGASITLIAASLVGLQKESDDVQKGLLDFLPDVQHARANTVRDYLQFHRAEFFQKSPWDELPYPSAAKLAELLDQPSIRKVLPASLRPAINLVADSSHNPATFIREPPPTGLGLPGKAPQNLPIWAAVAAKPAEFTSKYFQSDHRRVSIFVATVSTTSAFEFRLQSAEGTEVKPLQEKIVPDSHWHRLNFAVSPGQYRLTVNKFDSGWLRFTEPITDTVLSRATLGFTGLGNSFLTIGSIMGALALGFLVRRDTVTGISAGAREAVTELRSIPFRVIFRRGWARAAAVGFYAVSRVRRGHLVAFGTLALSGLAAFLSHPADEAQATFASAITAFVFTGALLGTLWYPLARQISSRGGLPPQWVALAAAAGVALVGYILLIIFYFSPGAGKACWVLTELYALYRCGDRATAASGFPDYTGVGGLAALVGSLYISGLFIYLVPGGMNAITATRIHPGMPGDNDLPHLFATRVYHHMDLEPFAGDWLSSDRPPMESAWQLIPWTAGDWLRVPDITMSTTAGAWLQLTWIFAAFGLLRDLGLRRIRAVAWILALSLSSFFWLNTVFVWPKLSAGAFGCGTFALWVLHTRRPGAQRSNILWGGLFAGIAWLNHGGVAFSLIPLFPWVIYKMFKVNARIWLYAGAIAALIVAPWFYYQHWVAPPGNRLLKWHLAGQIPITPLGTWETLRLSYGRLSWPEIIAHKLYNLRIQIPHPWYPFLDRSEGAQNVRRAQQFFHTGAALAWWLLGLAALPISLFFGSARRRLRAHALPLVLLFSWIVASLLTWCVLLFGEVSVTVVHQGSYALMLAAFIILSAACDLLGPLAIFSIAVLEGTTLLTTYVVSKAPPTGSALQTVPTIAAAGVVILILVYSRALNFRPEPSESR